MDVFGIFIAVSFIGLIVTLVVMNITKRIKKAQEYKPYSEYYVAEKSKDLGLAAKVLSDKTKTKVLTREYDVPNKQDSQELFDTGKMYTIVGLKFNTAPQSNEEVVYRRYDSRRLHSGRYARQTSSFKFLPQESHQIYGR